MGSGVSAPYGTAEDALAAGKTQSEIDAWISTNRAEDKVRGQALELLADICATAQRTIDGGAKVMCSFRSKRPERLDHTKFSGEQWCVADGL